MKFNTYSKIALAGLALAPLASQASFDLTWGDHTVNSASTLLVDVEGSGVDVSIEFTGTTSAITNYAIGTVPVTGGIAGDHLQISDNFASSTDDYTLTISFLATGTSNEVLVNNFAISFLDLDYRTSGLNVTSEEEISGISATDGTNTFAASITNGANTALTGSGLGQVVTGTALTGNSDSDANVTLDFSAQAISSFTVTKGSGLNVIANPGASGFAITDINGLELVPVPEAHHYATIAGLLSLASLVYIRRKKNV